MARGALDDTGHPSRTRNSYWTSDATSSFLGGPQSRNASVASLGLGLARRRQRRSPSPPAGLRNVGVGSCAASARLPTQLLEMGFTPRQIGTAMQVLGNDMYCGLEIFVINAVALIEKG